MSSFMANAIVSLQQRVSKLGREEGQGMVEYALILVLVSIAAIVLLSTVGTDVNAVGRRRAPLLRSAARPEAPPKDGASG